MKRPGWGNLKTGFKLEFYRHLKMVLILSPPDNDQNRQPEAE